MSDNQIRETIDELGMAFDSFKETNNKRLAQIERKGTSDHITNDKLSKIETALDKAESILRKSKASQIRPNLGAYTEKSTIVDPAFVNYIRKGFSHDLEKKALSGSNNEAGGYLVPQQLSQKIYSRLKELSPIRNLASVCEISTDALDILSEKGKATVGWVGEIEKRNPTNTPEFIKQRIPVHEIFARPKASQRLLDDAQINIDEWLSNKIASEMAMAENTAFVNGDGNNKPTGFLNYKNADIGQGEHGKIEHLVASKFIKNPKADILFDLYHAMDTAYLSDAVWLMPRSVQSLLRKLKDESTGQYLWQPGLEKGAMNILLGHPVVTIDEMPSISTEGSTTSIAFANMKRAYQIVDRQNISILRDPFTEKPYVEYYATKRVGGDVIDFNAIKLITFTNE